MFGVKMVSSILTHSQELILGLIHAVISPKGIFYYYLVLNLVFFLPIVVKNIRRDL